MEAELALDLPVAFRPGPDHGGEPVEVRMTRVRGEGAERWTSVEAVVETDAGTAARLADREFFHNTPENRLEEVQGGFNADLPVMFELVLRPERLGALPPRDEDLGAWLAAADGGAELLREDAWNARLVWQEHRLDPSIGGGVIKVGYRTAFSPPRDEIDALKRRGRVTRTVVEALIENGIPVRYEDDAFKVGLEVGDRAYPCRLRPDDAATSLTLTVSADAAPREGADGELEAVNRELPAGAFELADGELRYVHELRVDPALVSEGWVIETLRAGVSVMHHYAPRLLG